LIERSPETRSGIVATFIVTTNLSFDAWGTMFGGDEVIASAILDRLLHYSHVFLIAGPSYRMKDKVAQTLAETSS
jgi:DNA replication protein DnaC